MRIYIVRGESQTARELGEQMLSLAQRVHDPAGLAMRISRWAMPCCSCKNGTLPARTWSRASPSTTPSSTAPRASSPRPIRGSLALRCLAQVLWVLGYPDQALQRSQEALTLARELAHPASVATALYFAAEVHRLRREGQRTYELAEAALGLAREHGFAFRVAQATILRGWALVEQGQGRQGLRRYARTGRPPVPQGQRPGAYLILLAAAYGRVGQIEEGLRGG